jgi:hypothetical protein
MCNSLCHGFLCARNWHDLHGEWRADTSSTPGISASSMCATMAPCDGDTSLPAEDGSCACVSGSREIRGEVGMAGGRLTRRLVGGTRAGLDGDYLGRFRCSGSGSSFGFSASTEDGDGRMRMRRRQSDRQGHTRRRVGQ